MRTFVLVNSLLIIGFALGGLLFPEPFWRFFGVEPVSPLLARLMAWYLGTFGVGGVLASRDPERHRVMVAMLGVEKLGAAGAFAACQWVYGFNVPLAGVGLLDATVAVVLLRWYMHFR